METTINFNNWAEVNDWWTNHPTAKRIKPEIEAETIDMTSMMMSLMGENKSTENQDPNKLYMNAITKDMLQTLSAETKKNNLEEFKKFIENGDSNENIAKFVLTCISTTVNEMLSRIKQEYGDMPVVFSGGVMSNSILQSALRAHCELLGRESYFATPEFSSDNAAGVAILASLV